MRFAFKLAQSRPRKLLTVITKSNAQRHAMVMWDEIALQISQGVPGRDVGQGTGRCVDGAHDQPPGFARHHRRHQPARRHPQRPGRGARRQPGHRADRQHRSGAPLPVDVRADPRLGVRHHGQGPGQSGRHVLVGRDAARAPRRARRRQARDAGDRAGHRQPGAAHRATSAARRPRRRSRRPCATWCAPARSARPPDGYQPGPRLRPRLSRP